MTEQEYNDICLRLYVKKMTMACHLKMRDFICLSHDLFAEITEVTKGDKTTRYAGRLRISFHATIGDHFHGNSFICNKTDYIEIAIPLNSPFLR